MTGSRRVLVAGRNAREVTALAEAVAAAGESLTTVAATADGPDDIDDPGTADCVVWTGDADGDDLRSLAQRARSAAATDAETRADSLPPVVRYADGEGAPAGEPADSEPAECVDAVVRADEDGVAGLVARVERLLDRRDGSPESDDGQTDREAGEFSCGRGLTTDGGDRAGGTGTRIDGERGSDFDGEQVGGADETPAADGAALGRQFRGIVEQIDDPVFLKDRDGVYRYVNEPAAALFDTTADEVVGKTDVELFGEADAREIRAVDEEVMESGDSLTAEAAREYASGERVFRTRKHPYAPDGEVEGVVGISRDVIDERDARAELERNERALRNLQRLASDRQLSLAEKLERALDVGSERLDLSLGFLTRIDDDTQTIVASRGADAELAPGSTAPLCEAYCRKAIETDGLLAVERAAGEGWADDPAYERFGLECYLGGKLTVNGELFGTLCFGGYEGRDRAFSAAERTFIELLIEWVSYEVERRERERELERYETIVSGVDDGVYALDDGGRFTYANPGLAEMTGYAVDELVGEHVSVLGNDDAAGEALTALLSGEETELTVEARMQRKRGPPVPCEASMTALVDDGDVRGVVGVVRDVSEQVAHREMLSDLVTSSRSMMQARDREEVAEMVAGAVETVLGFEVTVVRLYDRERDRLVPAGETEVVADRGVEAPALDIDEGAPGRAFVDGETVVVEDADGLEAVPGRDTGDERAGTGADGVRSMLHLPMGVHGTISIGAAEPAAFSDVDRRAIQLLATTAAAAANRAKREEEVREARERVDTLVDRINGLIENAVEVLVEATTREELERGVVAQLAATDPYAFAWIGRPDLTEDTVEAAAWEGDDADLADAIADYALERATGRDEADPVALALETGEIQVVEDLSTTPDCSVHARARDAGLGSLIAVPLTYRDADYGVLCVYAAAPDAFAEREQVVLGALGRAVANAVNAIESGRILSTDRVVELEFTVGDDALPLARLSTAADADLALSGSVYESDGRVRLYVTATGADADDVAAALADEAAVVESEVIVADDDEVLVEATVTDSLVELLADHGAVTRAATAAGGTVRYTIELPYEAEAREVFDLVADRYAGTDLVGYHEHERPVRTRQEFREAVRERFTDRQETAIRTAHLGGFFEWPRDVDGEDLADAMDIARPTYHQHLRAAQRKVFEELFEPHDRRT